MMKNSKQSSQSQQQHQQLQQSHLGQQHQNLLSYIHSNSSANPNPNNTNAIQQLAHKQNGLNRQQAQHQQQQQQQYSLQQPSNGFQIKNQSSSLPQAQLLNENQEHNEKIKKQPLQRQQNYASLEKKPFAQAQVRNANNNTKGQIQNSIKPNRMVENPSQGISLQSKKHSSSSGSQIQEPSQGFNKHQNNGNEHLNFYALQKQQQDQHFERNTDDYSHQGGDRAAMIQNHGKKPKVFKNPNAHIQNTNKMINHQAQNFFDECGQEEVDHFQNQLMANNFEHQRNSQFNPSKADLNQGLIFESDFSRLNSGGQNEQHFSNFFDGLDDDRMEGQGLFGGGGANFSQMEFFGMIEGRDMVGQGGMDDIDNEMLGNISDHFGSQIMMIGGDDLNKLHQNFAGDTFSQISSTYEQQQQQLQAHVKGSIKHSSLTNNNINNQGILNALSHHQQSQPDPAEISRPESAPQHSNKLHYYQEKNRPSTKVKMHHHNNDELLDSMILNNLNDELNTQREQMPNAGQSQLAKGHPHDQQQVHNQRNLQNNIYEFKSQKQQSSSNFHHPLNHVSSSHMNPSSFNHVASHQLAQKIHAYPSSHSNLHLNQIIMNSEQLQQSEDVQSTMTIYNSGIFDDASIMRILDKSVSDDSLFMLQQQQIHEDLNLKVGQSTENEVERNFMQECEDIKQMLSTVSSKLKDKLLRHRPTQPNSNQLLGLPLEELKSFEMMVNQAVDKVRRVQAIGRVFAENERVRAVSFRKQREKLKVQVHGQVRRFKDLCKRQYRQTENWKFKYQINEYEANYKFQQLEERFDRQSEEINKLANKCEQLRYEKDCIAQQNEKKLKDMEKIVKVVILNLGKGGQSNSMVNNSFCVGTAERSMLLQPRSKRKIQNSLARLQSHTDMQQQSVDDKENESNLSNQGHKINNKEIKSYLKQVQSIIKQNRQYNQNYLKKDRHQMQEVGSLYDSSQMLNGGNYDPENQQSQLIPEGNDLDGEERELDMNQAFINNHESEEGEDSSQSANSKSNASYKPGDRMIDITEESLDYEFDQNQVIVDEQQQFTERSKQSLRNLLDIQDKISPQDLKGQGNRNFDHSPSDREHLIFEREKMLKNSGLQRIGDLHQQLPRSSQLSKQNYGNLMLFSNGNNHHQQQQQLFQNEILNFSNDNSIDADLQMLGDLEGNFQSQAQGKEQPKNFNDINLSQEFSGFLMNEEFKKSQDGEEAMNATGKNILVFDDFNQEHLLGSEGGLSRNQVIGGNANLYSGGSSQLSMIQAFPNSNRMALAHDDVIIVKVLDRNIKIPRLNIRAAMPQRDMVMFDKNIPDLNNTESSLTQSEIQPTLQSQLRNQQQANTDPDPQNITSFQNESISKQHQSSYQVDHTENSAFLVKQNAQAQPLHTEIDQDEAGSGFLFKNKEMVNDCMEGDSNHNLLDRAVFHESQYSKSNISKKSLVHRNSSNGKASQVQQPQGFNNGMSQNMFDSFKQELAMLDSIKKISGGTFENNNSSIAKQDKMLFNLDIDESLERDHIQQEFIDQEMSSHKQAKQLIAGERSKQIFQLLDQSEDEKSANELSINVSKFKKSLSDPNLMFNEVDSDQEEENKIGDNKILKKPSNLNMASIQKSQVLDMGAGSSQAAHKLKTPQNESLKNKFKFPAKIIRQNVQLDQQNKVRTTSLSQQSQSHQSNNQNVEARQSSNSSQQPLNKIKITRVKGGTAGVVNLHKNLLNERASSAGGQDQSHQIEDSSAPVQTASVNGEEKGLIQKVHVRKSLGSYQTNLRQSIGNQRNSQDGQSVQVNPYLVGQKDSFEFQSSDPKNPTFQNQSQGKVPQLNGKTILRALSANSNKTSENGGETQQETQAEQVTATKHPQLIRNYMKGAATMNGQDTSQMNSSVVKTSITKILNPKRNSFQRNSVQANNHSNQEEFKSNTSESQTSSQDPFGIQQSKQQTESIEESKEFGGVPLKNLRDSALMREMKEHLQSQELGGLDKNYLRRKQSSMGEAQELLVKEGAKPVIVVNWESCESALTSKEDSKLMELSPEVKRGSQTHTPKRVDAVLLNNQQVVLKSQLSIMNTDNQLLCYNSHNPKLTSNQVNLYAAAADTGADVTNMSINTGVNQSLLKQNLKRFNVKKVSKSKQPHNSNNNNSIMDNTVDQSSLIFVPPRVGEQNETFVGGINAVDSSIMINDISVIQPALGGSFAQKGSNFITGKKNLVKLNQNSKLNISNINGPYNQQAIALQNLSNINTSQLNQSSLNFSAISKEPNSQIMQNPAAKFQNIYERIIQQKESNQLIVNSKQIIAQANFNSNPNPVNNLSQVNDSLVLKSMIRGDSNSQSKDKLPKFPQRMLHQNIKTILSSGKKQVLSISKKNINSSNLSILGANNESSILQQPPLPVNSDLGEQQLEANRVVIAVKPESKSMQRMKELISGQSSQSPVPTSVSQIQGIEGRKSLQNKRREIILNQNLS